PDSPAPGALEEYWSSLQPTEGSKLEVFVGPPLFEVYGFHVHCNEEKLPRLRRAIANFAPDAIVCFDLEAAAAAAPVGANLKTVWLGDLNFRSMWYNYLYGFRETP